MYFWVLLHCTQHWNIFMSVHDTQGTLVISGNYSPCCPINVEVAPWSCSNRSTRVAIEFQTTGNYFPSYLVPCYVLASSSSHTHAHHDMCSLSRLWHRIEKLCFHLYLPQKPFKSELHCWKGQPISLSTVRRMKEWSLPPLIHTRLFTTNCWPLVQSPVHKIFLRDLYRNEGKETFLAFTPTAISKAVLRANVKPCEMHSFTCLLWTASNPLSLSPWWFLPTHPIFSSQ